MNAIGGPLRGLIHSEMTHYQLTAWVNSVTESGREEMTLGACIRVNLGVENERADAGWGSRTNVSRETKFTGTNVDCRENRFFLLLS